MRANIQEQELLRHGMNSDPARRLRVVIADASPGFMSVVPFVLELDEVVDLIGRAATFEEIVHLVLNHQPDLVLIDLDMPLANLAIPAIILASRNLVKIVGMCAGETVPLVPVETPTTVEALICNERLREEFLSILQFRFPTAAAFRSISSPPEPEQTTDQWRSGLSRQSAH